MSGRELRVNPGGRRSVRKDVVMAGGQDMLLSTAAKVREPPWSAPAALFRRHAPQVAHFLRHMGFVGTELEALVQDVFLVAHHEACYVKHPATPVSHLASIAMRAARAQLCARKPGQSSPRTQDRLECVCGAAVESARYTDCCHATHALDRVLASLSADERAVFILVELQGESVVAIAACCDLATVTVNTLLHEARNRFRDSTGRFWGRRAGAADPSSALQNASATTVCVQARARGGGAGH